MKKITLLLTLVVTTIVATAQTCPSSLKRSNGNGVCNGLGQLTLSYETCPTTADIIDSVYVNGIKYDVTFGPPTACAGAQHNVEYCITSGNMPPTGFWRIYFHNIIVIGGFDCIIPDGGPAPIELASFYAKRTGNNVMLNWQTSFEINAKSIEIERKTGKEFETVTGITAINKAEGSSYSYTDINTYKGTSQYRLKLIDKDGTYKYSEIRSVRGTGSVSEFTVYPNPSTGEAKVTITDIAEATDVQVVDNVGRIVKNITLINSNTVELNNLQKGMYMIRIVNKNSGESVTKKLTVIK